MPGGDIRQLGADLLANIVHCLDADSLATLCCTCRELKAAAENPSLWKALANDRWNHVHAASFPRRARVEVPESEARAQATAGSGPLRPSTDEQAEVNWKLLFGEGNGWEPPRLRHTAPLHSDPFGGGVCALQPVWLPRCAAGRDGDAEDEHDLMLAVGQECALQIWRISPGAFTQGVAARVQHADGASSGSGAGSRQGRGNGGSNIGTDSCSIASSSGAGDDRGSSQAGPGSSALGWGTGPPGVCGRAAAAPPVCLTHSWCPVGATSLAWIVDASQPSGRGPAAAGSGSGSGSSLGAPSPSGGQPNSAAATAVPQTPTQPRTGPAAPAASPPGSAVPFSTPAAAEPPAVAAAAAAAPTHMLVVGTRRGTLEWYPYEAQEARCHPAAAPATSVDAPAGRLRPLNSSWCGDGSPLAELHHLPPAAAAAAGAVLSPEAGDAGGVAAAWGGAGGLLAALQLAKPDIRSAVHLFDVATQRRLLTVRDPFESHEFVCCRPAAAGRAAPASVDPHVLLVGSVHGRSCAKCAGAPLPSLCSHKSRSATAALSTLDVRCGAVTQRFGLQHCSLYPRLATAREHYVFTSHAGTALEVYDRRAMSVPLYTRVRLPRPLAASAEEDEEAEEWEEWEEQGDGLQWEEEGGCSASGSAGVGGWRDGPAPEPKRHQGLWLEANDDVLLGRSDNGTLWLWDLSTTLGWARGPDRSGLWHWFYEHGPLPQTGAEAEDAGAGRGFGSGSSGGGGGPEAGGGAEGDALVEPARRAAPLGGPVCLGSVPTRGLTPMCVLAGGPGRTTALFNLGWAGAYPEDQWSCAVGSVLAVPGGAF